MGVGTAYFNFIPRYLNLYILIYLNLNILLGGFVSGSSAAEIIRDGVLSLCSSLKPEAVSLVDALAPPDFVLNSALGQSDGQIYKNIQASIFQAPGALARPSWWQEITFWQDNLNSKL